MLDLGRPWDPNNQNFRYSNIQIFQKLCSLQVTNILKYIQTFKVSIIQNFKVLNVQNFEFVGFETLKISNTRVLRIFEISKLQTFRNSKFRIEHLRLL